MDLEIFLVRHAQTEYNAAARLQGWCDSPLTAAGEAQAARLGRWLAAQNITFDGAYCSTLPRTAATARTVLAQAGQSGLPLHALDDLREYRFGSRFEGQPAHVLYEAAAAACGLPDGASWLKAYREGSRNLLADTLLRLCPEEAESEAAFTARLRRGIADIAARHPHGGRVLAVTHGMAAVALLKSVRADAIAYQSPPNASVSRLLWRQGCLNIVSIGETAPENL